MSRVAKMPITLPKGVECSVTATNVTVKGPKGSLSLPKMEGVGVKVDAAFAVHSHEVVGGFVSGRGGVDGERDGGHVVTPSNKSLHSGSVAALTGNGSGRSLSNFTHRCFISVGWSVRRGLPSVCFHWPPPADPSQTQPAARSVTPVSDSRM